MRRRRGLPLGELRRGPFVWWTTFQTSSASSPATTATDAVWRALLSRSPNPAPYAGTMYTGVPISTCANSHSACGISMRMQPCEAE